MNQDVLVVLLTAYVNIANMWLQMGNEVTESHIPVYLQRPDAKARSIRIKCVSLLYINFDGFSSENVL